MENNPCIELSDVSFKWPSSHTALISIDNLAINSGERVFIQGASGSGKSTLLNIITGVLNPSSGTIKILETTIESLSQSQRDQFRADHFGIIFQQFNLIPYLSVLENVTLPLSFSAYKLKRTEILESDFSKEALKILNALGINLDTSQQNVTQLSSGQQQRVAAARALIGTPEIIIADEPTSSLDEDAKHNFIELLFNAAKKFNSTIIFVSHDQSLASMFDKTFQFSDFKTK